FASTIHPGILSALLVVGALRALLRLAAEPGDIAHAHRATFFIGVLPWVHFGMMPVVAFLSCALLVIERRPRDRLLSSLLLALAALGPLLLVYVFMFYSFGGPTYAALKSTDLMTGSFSPRYLVDSLPGLLIDRAKGLVVFAPVYLEAIAGLLILLRTSSRRASWLII